MEENSQPKGIQLVGSVPLEDSGSVFDLASSLLGQHLHRIPDGETGERSNWVRWQFAVLAETPQLETVTYSAGKYGKSTTQVKLRSGYSAEDIEFGPLGYSEAAISSYAEFAKQKQAGKIPASVRFQVSLPTPLAPLQFYVAAEDRAEIEPIYEAKLLRELEEIVEAIPASELAIQWDTAVEFGILEGVFPTFLVDPPSAILDRLVRLGNSVPAEVELGYHLCYGDSGHKHFVEPKDTAHLVNVANGIANGLKRPLNWVHLPVPKERFDQAFYLPLQSLSLHAETELYLGLIHDTDGVEGTQKRIEAALKVIDEFGLATECGFGRRPSETVPDLMQIHAAVAAPIR
ncbi:MAG: hypothetical protein AAF902_10695 [Chloroflexota bacterium]